MLELVPAKSILARNKDPRWFGIDYQMNLYRGCCHGCIYCDSRSECYGVQDFDTVRVKSDALAVIRNDLRSKTQSGVVATGSMSDPYNPFEKELQLTRHARPSPQKGRSSPGTRISCGRSRPIRRCCAR